MAMLLNPFISFPSGSAPLVGDYYVDYLNGNDVMNSGTSRAAAWKTLSKLKDFCVTLPAASTTTFVLVNSGVTWVTGGTGWTPTMNNNCNIKLEFEPFNVFDFTAGDSGFYPQGDCSVVLNMRGATMLGSSIASANGIGSNNNTRIQYNGWDENGAGPLGERTIIDGFDDGMSGHGTAGPLGDIVARDFLVRNCTKSGFAHVNSTIWQHYNCTFEARAGATLGVGDDQSTLKSQFFNCTFTPATAGQTCRPYHAENCVIGTLALNVTFGNISAQSKVQTLIDCFVNSTSDGFHNVDWTRCYGYYDFRIRGPVTNSAIMKNCVFEGRTNTTGFAQGTFDGGGGAWLGGSPIFRDTIIYDYGTAFSFASTTQRDHMNANWTVENCAMFDNTTNFQAGLTIGTSLVTTDPLLGARNSTNASDWGYGAGSPCIGAGTAGGNIGFAA
jgi:hypothetical protein